MITDLECREYLRICNAGGVTITRGLGTGRIWFSNVPLHERHVRRYGFELLEWAQNTPWFSDFVNSRPTYEVLLWMAREGRTGSLEQSDMYTLCAIGAQQGWWEYQQPDPLPKRQQERLVLAPLVPFSTVFVEPEEPEAEPADTPVDELIDRWIRAQA